jgi:WD40 repeat protein
VFISHTSELRDFPQGMSYVAAAERAISAAGHVIVDMADFPAAGQAPARVCAERVRGCDVYVGILGTRYGSPVRDRHGMSYTELEFDTAAEAGLDRLVFLLDTDAEQLGIPASALIDREFGARQDAFRRRVQDSGLSTQCFASPAALGQLVERSLRDLADTRRRREQVSAEDVLADGDGRTPGAARRVARWARGCPYRGLLPFGEADADVFYGRERLAAELAVKLAARVSRGGMVVVTGASGSGKSSLLRAGLLPILARGQQVPGSDRWPRIVMTPTKDPLTELAARLAAVGGPDALAVRDGLMRHPDQVHLAIRSAVLAATRRDEQPPSGDSGPRLVLIVDQFEQVFTLNPDPGGEATRQAFITALRSAATNPVGPGQVPPALVVTAVRGDFWDQCAAVPELVSALQDGQFVVGPMTESELRVAITGPAEAAGLRIDPALTDTILGDLRAAGEDRSAGVLPLLSQAMALTWEQREGDRLTSHGYAQAGGVSRAVQTAADRAYGALPAGQQTIAQEMLRSMTVARRDGGLARRPVTRQDLYAGLPGAARADIDAVLDAFAAERLTVLDGDKAQLSHDVLLRAWPRLRGWLEEDQANWILHGQLADAADAWHDSHDDQSFLYRGAQLTALQQAVTRWSADPARYPVLTGTQRNFLQASGRAAARGRLRRRTSLAVLAVLTVLAMVASGIAFYQRAEAVQQRDQAIYNRVIAKALQFGTSDTPLAAQLTLAAYRIRRTQDLESSLLNTENTPLSSALATGDPIVTSVAVSSHGHMLADGGSGGRVRLWDVADLARPRPLGWPLTDVSALVYSLAFSPDGHTLASGGLDGRIRLWDVADPAHPRPLSRPLASGVPVNSVAFSPDGRTLADGGYDGRVRLWDVADPAHPRPLATPLGPLAAGVLENSVAFSADGHTLASGGVGGRVRLWDVADPAHPRPLGPPLAGGVAVDSVAFSPDRHTLAGGGLDGTVWLWDVADPAHPRTLGPILTGGVAVDSVAFSPDGHILVGGGLDGVIRLWGVADPAHPSALGQPLTGGGGAVDSVAFSRDGRTLASGGIGGTIRLWSLPQTVLTGGTIGFNSVAFSPDGHTLASSGYGGMVRLWGTADPAHPRPLGPPLAGGGIGRVAFSPDGHTLAGAGDTTVRLWHVADPAHPTPLGPPLAGGGAVDSVAFSPNGQTLAVGLADSTVRLWGVADPAHPQQLGQPLTSGGGAVGSVAFSRDGRMLASGGLYGIVRLWGVADPAHPQQLGQPLTSGVGLDSVAFSDDGRMLASGALDGTVQLWDIADPAHPQHLGSPLTSGTAAIRSVAFSRDGRMLASGGLDGTVRLWGVADPAHPQQLGQPLTSGVALDSVAFSGDGHTLASGGDDGTTRLWNLNVQYAIERICATAGGLTLQDWNKYMSELQYQPSCIP